MTPTPSSAYARFLPAPWRTVAEAIRPESTWWKWPQTDRSGGLGAVDVHVARHTNPDAPIRVMLVHGAGGHSGLVWPLGAILAAEECEVLAPDLPLYGLTRVEKPGLVRYSHWVDILSDLVAAETADDPRPLVLFGASMGGMLCYEVAHRNRAVDAVVVTCLLDLADDPSALRSALRNGLFARCAPLMSRLPKAATRIRIPVTWFAPVARMSADPELSRQCITDPLGAASRLPLGFLADLTARSVPLPEQYDGARVLLVHPAADAWTPAEVSVNFARRIAGRVDIELLTGCGHFPIEQPGIDELAAHLRKLRADLLSGRR